MRLFIGIEIPSNIRHTIYVQAMRMQQLASGKYVREDMYHITLAYIGESDEAMRILAAKCIRSTALITESPLLIPGSPGYFGKPEKAILHLGVTNAQALQPINDILRNNLTAAGLPFDPKPLVPHITLARNVAINDALLSDIYEHQPFRAECLTLFNSCRIDDILQYIPIYRIPFGGIYAT